MHQFEAAFAHWVIRNRWGIVAVAIVLLVIAAAGIRHLHFTSSYRVYFGPDNPQRVAFEELENTYVKNDNLIIVVAPEDGEVFTRENLSIIEEVTKRAWQIPYANRVDSITNFQYTEAEQDNLIIRDLVRNAAKLSNTELTRIKQIALNEPLLRGSLIRENTRVTGLFINIQLPGEDETAENAEIIGFARKLAAEIEDRYPGIRIYLTGMVMMNNAFPEATVADLTSLIPLSFALMIVLLGVLVGSFVSTLSTVLVLAFSIAGALGLAGYIGFPLTPVSAVAPTIILTISIANCVHILVSFLRGMRHHLNKHEALEESLRINLQPVFIASITTAIGFLSLNFSEVPPFQHLGTIVALGVLISFVLAVSLLPALIAVLPVRTPEQTEDDDSTMVRLGDFVVRHRDPLP